MFRNTPCRWFILYLISVCLSGCSSERSDNEPDLGDTDLADTALGDTALGDTVLGDTDLGDTDLGDAALGDTDLGDVVRDLSGDADTSADQSMSSSPIEFQVQIPSEAGGVEGIAVSVIAPAAGLERYPEGAPVAVSVMGGWSLASEAAAEPKLAQHGIVSVGGLFFESPKCLFLS